LAKALRDAGHELWIFSGRNELARQATVGWLVLHGLDFFERIQLRSARNRAPDDILKRAWFEKMPAVPACAHGKVT
jgi:hypothetical protein